MAGNARPVRRAAALATALVVFCVSALGAIGAGGCRAEAPPADDPAAADPADPGSGSGNGSGSGSASGSGDAGGSGGDPAAGDGDSAIAEVPRDLAALRPDLAAGYDLVIQRRNPAGDNCDYLLLASPWTSEPVGFAEDATGGAAWHPDGSAVVYIRQFRRDDAPVLTLYRPGDGTYQEVRTFAPDEYFNLHTPGCSPDGAYYAVEDGTSCNFGLHILDQSGRTVGQLGIYGGYLWSPDSTHLAYGKAEPLAEPLPIEGGDSQSLHIVSLAGGEDRLLARGDQEYGYGPVAWPEPGRLVYSRTGWFSRESTFFEVDPFDPGAEPSPVDPGFSGLATLNRDRAWVQEFLPESVRGSWTGFYSFSPDGSALIVVTQVHVTGTVHIFDVETGDHGVLGAGNWAWWSPAPAAAGP